MRLADAECIFHEALAIEDPNERRHYVSRRCAEDRELREKIQRLLQAHENSPEFLREVPGNSRSAQVQEEKGTIIDRYKLLENIGEGGFGVVYMAEQMQPVKRLVALKIIKLGMDTKQVIARFEAERQALAMMDHPNIAKVLDGGATSTGRPYFVMELVRGVPITQYCDENRLAIRERLELFIAVCHAVQHAHQKGIIHRDLKPSNILVVMQEGAAVAKVIDFGIAKATQQELTERTLFTHFHQIMGTPAYVSPEQMDMQLDIDTRSDIYSLGVLLYELLTGETPLNGIHVPDAGYDEIRRRITEEEPIKPSARARILNAEARTTAARCRKIDPARIGVELQGDLDWIVMKALEKDRTRRYDTAKGFANDVRRFLQHRPVEAAAPSLWYLARKRFRRHRASFLAAGLVLVALLVGVVGSVSQAIRATRSSERERAAHQQVLHSLQTAREAEDRANSERRRVESLLTQLDADRAEEYFAAAHYDRGLASLARALRREPQNQVVAGRLVDALTSVSYMLPLGPNIEHAAGVSHALFTPNEEVILTISDDLRAQLWDATTFAPLGAPMKQDSEVRSVCFSPDGDLLAIATKSGTVQLWRVPEARPAGEPLSFGSGIRKIQWSPTGSLLVGGGDDGMVRVWDVQGGRWANPPLHHGSSVLDISFDPKGAMFAVACKQNEARVCTLLPNLRASATLPHPQLVTHVLFSPDGERLLTACHDGQLRLWDTESWQLICSTSVHNSSIAAIQFSPDGSRIASGSWDCAARIIDGLTGTPLTPPLVHGEAPTALDFVGSGELLATASRDAKVRLWTASKGTLAAAPATHDFLVYSIHSSHDGSRLLSGSKDGTARVLDAIAGNSLPLRLNARKPLTSLLVLPDDQVLAGSVSDLFCWSPMRGTHERIVTGFPDLRLLAREPTGTRVAMASFSGSIRILRQADWSLEMEIQHAAPLNSIEFSPDGRYLLAAGTTADLWDLGSDSSSPLLSLGEKICEASFSPDGKQFVTASWDYSAQVRDALTGEAMTPPLQHDLPVLDVEFDPSGQWITTASRDQKAGIWEATSGRLRAFLPHRHEVEHLRFSPKGHLLATASGDHRVHIWHVPDGNAAIPIPLRHSASVTAMEFSPDGRWLATGSEAGEVRLWSVRDGMPLSHPITHEGPVSGIQFTDRGRTLLTASYDGMVLRHDLPIFGSTPPAWLPELAEAVGGLRLTARGDEEIVSVNDFLLLKKRLLADDPQDEFDRWAEWFLASRRTRNLSFRTSVPTPEFVDRCLTEGTPAALRIVLRLNPTNTRAFSMLQELNHSQRR